MRSFLSCWGGTALFGAGFQSWGESFGWDYSAPPFTLAGPD